MSTFFRGRVGAAEPAQPLRCRLSPPDLHAPALHLILGSAGEVADFRRFARGRGIDLNQLWIAERGGQLLWGLIPIVSPGRTMLLLSPTHCSGSAQRSAAETLIDTVCTSYGERGLVLAQVLLDPPLRKIAALYQARGFIPMAELVYLQKELRQTVPPPAVEPRFSWQNYSAESHDRFARAVVETYHGSLDCPALNGLREIDDTLAGHKATGEFDPDLWFLLTEGDVPVGVLLLSRTTHADAIELVYLGLPPGARGRGIGDLLMRQALSVAARHGARHLSLAVDSRNHPAMKLYHRHGLQRICTKRALLRDLRGDASGRVHARG